MRTELKVIIVGMSVVAAGSVSYSFFGELFSTSVLAEEEPDIVLVTMESTRVDHIGPCMGYGRNTTPNICGFAEDGVVFRRAYAHAPYTLPALTALHTSQLPIDIGTSNPQSNLSDSEETLAEVLKENGYSTHAVVRSPFTHPRYGMDQGFDSYKDVQVSGPAQSRMAIKLIAEEEEQFFLWLHLYPPHQPYTPPRNLSGLFSEGVDADVSANHTAREFDQLNLSEADIEYIRARYDEYLRHSDHAFGLLLDGLKDLGVYEESVVIYTADHGEDLMNHGVIGHGYSLYEPVTRVPLIVKQSDGRNSDAAVNHPVGHRDIFPLVEEVLGYEEPRGTSLLGLVDGEGERPPVIVNGGWVNAIIDGRWKLIRGAAEAVIGSEGFKLQEEEVRELYEITADRSEEDNLFNQRERVALRLSNNLLSRLDGERDATGDDESLPDDLEERLRKLGYIK